MFYFPTDWQYWPKKNPPVAKTPSFWKFLTWGDVTSSSPHDSCNPAWALDIFTKARGANIVSDLFERWVFDLRLNYTLNGKTRRECFPWPCFFSHNVLASDSKQSFRNDVTKFALQTPLTCDLWKYKKYCCSDNKSFIAIKCLSKVAIFFRVTVHCKKLLHANRWRAFFKQNFLSIYRSRAPSQWHVTSLSRDPLRHYHQYISVLRKFLVFHRLVCH